jgi:acyl-CoA thioesterase-1
LLIFGDSLAAGYGLAPADAFQAQLAAALKADGFDVQILDGGVSGDTTAGGRSRLDWALADKPDAVMVELGGNDGLRGTEPSETEANLTAILDSLAAKHIPTLAGVAGDPALNQADHIHPNPEGVKRVVARIKPAVEALLREVTAPS